MNILLGITGSVASIYTDKLINQLKLLGNVRVVLTKQSEQFSECQSRSDIQCFVDEDETWQKLGDDILHIELRKWADVMVIAPLSANSLAKIHYGLCDNLLTSIVRCWDFSKKIIVCPSMNCEMWNNQPTGEQIDSLTKRGFIIIPPVEKKLACGDTGIGALAEHQEIIKQVRKQWKFPLSVKNFIPTDNHPGAFWYHRHGYFHTGVDLYCRDGDEVFAVENGMVIKHGLFTGKRIGSPHWNETYYTAVHGESGVVVYGEIYENVESPIFVKKGDRIGYVKQVIQDGKERPDIPHHSKSMLHIELYRHESYSQVWTKSSCHYNFNPIDGDDDYPKDRNLLNPTNRLLLSQ